MSWKQSEETFLRKEAIKCVWLTSVTSMRARVGREVDSGDKTYKESGDFHMRGISFSSKVAWSILRHPFNIKNKVWHPAISTSEKGAQCLVGLFEFRRGIFLLWEVFSCLITK